MSARVLAGLVAVLFWLGAAHADEGQSIAIFPQLGHAYPVMSVAFAPDGKLLASASADKTVKLWDVASGRELRTLEGHQAGVLAVAFSPDSRLLASASADKTVIIWDVASGRALHTLGGHSDIVRSVAFSPDGKLVASGSLDRTVKLWDAASGRLLGTFIGRTAGFMAVAFSPSGKTLLTASADGRIEGWSIPDGRDLGSLAAYSGLSALAFAPDGKAFAASSVQSGIKVWAAPHVALLRAWPATKPVNTIAFARDGKTLASADGAGTIRLLDISDGHVVRTFSGGTAAVLTIAFSPDGKTLAAGSWDHTISLWNWSTGRRVRMLEGHAAAVDSVAVSPDGTLIAAPGWDHAIALWNAHNGEIVRIFKGHEGGVMSAAFSPDEKTLASGGADKTVRLWDVASGRQLHMLSGHTDTVNGVAFSPDGKRLASGSDDRTVRIWDAQSGRLLQTLSGHKDAVESVAFSPDGKWLASGSDDHTIILWDMARGAPLHVLSGHGDWVNSVIFSPDGQEIASGSFDNTIRFWDVARGALLRTLASANGPVIQIAFSPNGKLLASANEDKTASLWDLAGGRVVRRFVGHTNVVNGAAFTPDAKTLVTASTDGSVREWNAQSGAERVALIAFSDGSSIAVTPNGYFDSSSEAAEESLNVRIGSRVFDIGSFREHFFRPDLVKASIAGTSLGELENLNSVKLSPVVEMVDVPDTTTAGQLKLSLRLTNGGGGFGVVRVFWNGTVIQQDGDIPAAGNIFVRNYSIPLFGGDNALRVAASNAEGTMWSDANATVAANFPAAAKGTRGQGTLHAVVLGIQTYPHSPSHNLTYANGDAALFADTLKKYAAPLFAHVAITTLTGPDETNRTHVMQVLQQLRGQVAPGDQFVFYVASHGIVANGQYYLGTSNIDPADPAGLARQAISAGELAELFANIPVGKKLVVIDTCDSQTMGDVVKASLANKGMNARTAVTIIGRSIGLTILAATATDQEALEANTLHHGLFTFAVANGLAGKARHSANGVVDGPAIADYVRASVPELARTMALPLQQPTTDVDGKPFPVTQVR